MRLGLRCRVGIGSSSHSGLRMCFQMRMFWRRTSQYRRLVKSVCVSLLFILLHLRRGKNLHRPQTACCAKALGRPPRATKAQIAYMVTNTTIQRMKESENEVGDKSCTRLSALPIHLVVRPNQHSRFGGRGLGTAWTRPGRTERSQQDGMGGMYSDIVNHA